LAEVRQGSFEKYTVSRNNAPAGKPAGLSPATYRSPQSQRPTSQSDTAGASRAHGVG